MNIKVNAEYRISSNASEIFVFSDSGYMLVLLSGDSDGVVIWNLDFLKSSVTAAPSVSGMGTLSRRFSGNKEIIQLPGNLIALGFMVVKALSISFFWSAN
jgi:hypothetical protein